MSASPSTKSLKLQRAREAALARVLQREAKAREIEKEAKKNRTGRNNGQYLSTRLGNQHNQQITDHAKPHPDRTVDEGDGTARALIGGQKGALFLRELERTPVLGFCAKAAGISTETIRKWRKKDPAFDLAVRDALEVGIDRLEAETIHQALQPSSQGNPTHLLKMFTLKSKRREVYGERLEVNQTHRHEIVIDLVPAGQAQPPLLGEDGAVVLDHAPQPAALPAGDEDD